MSRTSSRSSQSVSQSVLRGGEDTPARPYRGELSAISGSVTCGNTLPPRYLRGRCGSCGKLSGSGNGDDDVDINYVHVRYIL